MTANDNLLEGLFDYAGLFPPANLDLRTAFGNYATYRRSKDSRAIGRFVVDLDRVDALLDAAGDCYRSLSLTVVAPANANWDALLRSLDAGAPIAAIEVKTASPSEIECIARQIPAALAAYFEVPVDSRGSACLDAICVAGANAKLRMGGVVAKAFPSSQAVAAMLQAMADRHLAFKATAGLHHPLRSCHPFTDTPGSASGMMHGFVNLCCAAALIHLGGDAALAADVLEETDPHAWRISPEAIGWREITWRVEQIRAARHEFFVSIGSCSFLEPMADMEALGWL
jgi:hypothetical protein